MTKENKPKQISLIFIPIFAGLLRSAFMYFFVIKPQNFIRTMGFIFGETFLLTAIPLWIIMFLNKRLRKVWQDEEESSSKLKKWQKTIIKKK